MTTHALSDTWLTDSLEWDNGAQWIDVPFLNGTPVRIQERKVVAYDDQFRLGLKIWIGKDATEHSGVLIVGEGESRKIYCSEHENSCDCRLIALRYLEAK